MASLIRLANWCWSRVREASILYLVLFAAMGYLTYSYHHDSSKADTRAFSSRIGSAKSACNQFNSVQAATSDLIVIFLSSPRTDEKKLTPAQRKNLPIAIGGFVNDLKALAPNDCKGQGDALRHALKTKDFAHSVSYTPSPAVQRKVNAMAERLREPPPPKK